MPPFVHDLEAWIYFTRPLYTIVWLALEALFLAIPLWLMGCRLACNGTFALGKGQKENAANRLRRWAYSRPGFLRVIQSPVHFWLAMALVGGFTFHLAVLYPSVGARTWSFNQEAHQVVAEQGTAQLQEFKLQRIAGWQLPWLNAAKFELKWGQPLWWTPFPKGWMPGAGDAATDAAALTHQAHMVELGSLLAFLFGLVFAFKAWSREATGERHQGRAGWASRAEVACVTGKGGGYFRIPLQVSQDGSRQWEKTFHAPFTVLAPSATSNCGHGLMIGPTGSGKGAFTFGHIFATATVPIIYQDSKGECPAWRMRPGMIRFGIPANKPKGLPSMRYNPIAEIRREDLTANQRADRARVLASLLLPTPAEKNANSWINETAQPLLAMGLLQRRWADLGELADEVEGHPLPFILSSLAVAAGRIFSLGGKNAMEYASNEIANNTAPYLRGWARHAFSASDFTMADIWKRGAYIMSATEEHREKIPINLMWNLIWNDAQSSDKPLPCLVLLDECVAAGRIPGIVSATVKLRDRGFSIWMAFQTYAGITQVYGRDEGEALRRALVNTIILTNGLDSKDAAEVAEELGEWTHSEKNKKAGTTTRTKFPLMPKSDLAELAGQESQFWGIFRGRGMSSNGRPILAKLFPIQRGLWNCLATGEEYRAEEERYGHQVEVTSRYAYTLTPEYRQAATLALRLADGDGNKTIALFERLEKAAVDLGLEAGCADFTTQVLTKKGKGNEAEAEPLVLEDAPDRNDDYPPPPEDGPDDEAPAQNGDTVDPLPEDF